MKLTIPGLTYYGWPEEGLPHGNNLHDILSPSEPFRSLFANPMTNADVLLQDLPYSYA